MFSNSERIYCISIVCLRFNPTKVYAYLGDLNAGEEEDNETKIEARVLTHRSYKTDLMKTLKNDIALLWLTKRAPTSDKVKIIHLPPPEWSPPLGTKIEVAGWGRYEMASSKSLDRHLIEHRRTTCCLLRDINDICSISPGVKFDSIRLLIQLM